MNNTLKIKKYCLILYFEEDKELIFELLRNEKSKNKSFIIFEFEGIFPEDIKYPVDIKKLSYDDIFTLEDYIRVDKHVYEIATSWFKLNNIDITEFENISYGNLISEKIQILSIYTLKIIYSIIKLKAKFNIDEIIYFKRNRFIKGLDDINLPLDKINNSLLDGNELNIIEFPEQLKKKRNLFCFKKKNIYTIFNKILFLNGKLQFFLNRLMIIKAKYIQNIICLTQIRYLKLLKEFQQKIKNIQIISVNSFSLKFFLFSLKNKGFYYFPLDSFISLKNKRNFQYFLKILILKFKQKLLKEKFVFENINYAPLIEENIIFLILREFQHYYQYIFLLKKFYKKIKPKLILNYGDESSIRQIFSILGNQMDIPTLYFQHGINSENPDYYIPKTKSKYVLAWGNLTKKYFISKGHKPFNIIHVGNPQYYYILKDKNIDNGVEKIKKKYHLISNRKIILFTTLYDDLNFSFIYSKNKDLIKFRKILKYINQNYGDFKDYYILIKYHPNESLKFRKLRDHLIKKYNKGNLIRCDINENIFWLIKTSDVLFSGVCTTILEALLFDKPVILLNFQHWQFHLKSFLDYGAIIEINSEYEILKNLNKLFFDEHFQKTYKENVKKFLQEFYPYIRSKEQIDRYLRIFKKLIKIQTEKEQ